MSARFRIIDVDGLGDEAIIVRREPVGLLLIGTAMSHDDRMDVLEQAMDGKGVS